MKKTVAAATDIAIHAPIDKIWQIMLDTNKYGEWNSFVVKAEANGDVSKPGTAMKLHVRWQNGKGATSGEIITEAKAPTPALMGLKEACWAYRFTGWLAMFGLVKATRYQWLQEENANFTIYRTREEFTGLLKNFIPLAEVQHGFERQAANLKHRAESNF